MTEIGGRSSWALPCIKWIQAPLYRGFIHGHVNWTILFSHHRLRDWSCPALRLSTVHCAALAEKGCIYCWHLHLSCARADWDWSIVILTKAPFNFVLRVAYCLCRCSLLRLHESWDIGRCWILCILCSQLRRNAVKLETVGTLVVTQNHFFKDSGSSCDFLWGNCSAPLMVKIEKVQWWA